MLRAADLRFGASVVRPSQESMPMPYPRAWLYLLLLLGLTVLAFWPGYFSKLNAVPWQYHVHGVTATLWMLLLVAQGLLIHRGQRAGHRLLGTGSLLLVPAFLAGGLLVMGTMAQGQSPFHAMYAHRLIAIDFFATLGFAAFVAAALAQRRRVAEHAGWLMATPLLLISPVLARLFSGFLPPFAIRGLEDLPRFAGSVHLAQLVALALAVALGLQARQHAKPYCWAALLLIVQSLGFEFLGAVPVCTALCQAWGAAPPAAQAALGLALGAGVVTWGWRAAPQRGR